MSLPDKFSEDWRSVAPVLMKEAFFLQSTFSQINNVTMNQIWGNLSIYAQKVENFRKNLLCLFFQSILSCITQMLGSAQIGIFSGTFWRIWDFSRFLIHDCWPVMAGIWSSLAYRLGNPLSVAFYILASILITCHRVDPIRSWVLHPFHSPII